jgi:hypothetical protein
VVTGNHTTDGSGAGAFTSTITGLTAGTLYYVRSYATNSTGTAYGNEITFTTLTAPVLPTVTTASVTAIAQTTATSGGNVTAIGSSPVTARGVCWGTGTCPVVTGNHTTDGSGAGAFTSSITGLTPGTLYYVRSYATNSTGTAYGNELTFTTLVVQVAPTVTTTAVTAVTQTTATSGGNVTATGSAPVTARGVCWSTTHAPTTACSHTTDGSGAGSFSSSVTGLTPATTYFIRAYATSTAGTSYGAELSFTTQATTMSSVTTNQVTSIKSTSATCGGNVTSDGGSPVTTRGVCWNTTGNPTIGNSHTHNGSGTGSFTSYMTGLNKHTRYYVRAYATNANGTSYGEQRIFTTLRGWADGEEAIDTTAALLASITMNVYPNPVVATTTVEYDLPENSNVSLAVYNLNGVKLYSEQFLGQSQGVHKVQLNASAYATGMYIVTLTTEKSSLTKRFIKIIQ